MFSEINLLNSAASGNEKRRRGHWKRFYLATRGIRENDTVWQRWSSNIMTAVTCAALDIVKYCMAVILQPNGWCLTPQRAQSLILFHREFSLWWAHIKTENTCKEFLKLPLLLDSAVSCTKCTFLPELIIFLTSNYCLCQYCNTTMCGPADANV